MFRKLLFSLLLLPHLLAAQTTKPVINTVEVGGKVKYRTESNGALKDFVPASLSITATDALTKANDALTKAGSTSTTVGNLQSALNGLQQTVTNIGSGTITPAERIMLYAKNLSAQTFLGSYNAATNSPVLSTTGVPGQGGYYEVSTAGSTSAPTGSVVAYGVGDKLISNGTAWVRIPAVTLGVVIEGSANLYDGTVIAGQAVNGSGDIGSFANFSRTDYISVLPSTTYTLSMSIVASQRNIQFSDINKTKISVLSVSSYPSTFTTPANTAYVVFTVKRDDQASAPTNIQLEQGSAFTGYVPYVPRIATGISGAPIRAAQLTPGATMGGNTIATVNQLPSVPNLSVTAASKNLFNLNTVVVGQAVAQSTGAIGSYANFSRSDYIPAQPSTTYTLSSSALTGQRCVQFSDVAKVQIPNSFSCTASYPFTFTTPVGTANIVFTLKRDDQAYTPSSVQLEQGNAATGYIAYQQGTITANSGQLLVANSIASGTKMGGQDIATVNMLPTTYQKLPTNFNKLLVIGSSIAVGSGASNDSTCWRRQSERGLSAAYKRPITIANGGVGGQQSPSMLASVDNLLATHTPEGVFLETTINNTKVPGQSLVQSEADYTAMINKVRAYGAVPILITAYAVDPPTAASSGNFQQWKRRDLNAMITRLGKEMNVQVIHVEDQDFTNLNDGVHMNDKGQRQYAEKVTAAIIEN